MAEYSAGTAPIAPTYSPLGDEFRSTRRPEQPLSARLEAFASASQIESTRLISDPWSRCTGAVFASEAVARDRKIGNLADERLSLVVKKHAYGELSREEDARLRLLTMQLDGLLPRTESRDVLER